LADDGVLSEQLEGVAAGLGDSKVALGHAMHGEIDRRLAGAEDVQDDGILDGEIIEPARVIPVFLRDALQAAADDRRLVQVDVVNHDARTGCRSSLRRA